MRSQPRHFPPKPARPRATAKPRLAAPDDDTFPIVGIGASAGGLEAMTQLLRSLPADTGMAFVLVQHLDPSHESSLASILARSTLMPVVEARHRMQLAANRIHVIPPNKLIGLSARRLTLAPRGETDSHLAVDHFLRGLAEQDGNRAIGVVLSGNGSDGSQGLVAIKTAGGITFAQDESTAKYPLMPRSAIATRCVDFVLAPDGIARELARLSGHSYIVWVSRPRSASTWPASRSRAACGFASRPAGSITNAFRPRSRRPSTGSYRRRLPTRSATPGRRPWTCWRSCAAVEWP